MGVLDRFSVRRRAERPCDRDCCNPAAEWDPRVPSGMGEQFRLHREWLRFQPKKPNPTVSSWGNW